MVTKKPLLVVLVLSALLLITPATAFGQAVARPAGGHVSVGVGVGVGPYHGGWYGYPYWGWGPYWGCCGYWGGWGPWWGGPYYGGWYYGGSIQIKTMPKETEVYVDGWRAGTVNDYDSWYQGLTLSPGGHEIALYLDGYRTQRHNVYFAYSSSQKLNVVMEKVAAGESSGPRPQPVLKKEGGEGGQGGYPRNVTALTNDKGETEVHVQLPPPPPPRFGTLSLMVQPPDATVMVDDQKWVTSGPDQRLAIKLAPGRHQLTVSKDGHDTYTETLLIRSDATMNLNVGLTSKK